MPDPRPANEVARVVLQNTRSFLEEMPPFQLPERSDPSLWGYRKEKVISGIVHALYKLDEERKSL